MSFPVPGTLMIEPTESELKAELDRFCDAMIAIRQRDRRDRSRPLEGRGLAAAPRAAHRARHRRRRLGRAPIAAPRAAFPAGTSRTDKYWSPVGRVDNVYGDRNLVCSCPPVDGLRAGGGVRYSLGHALTRDARACSSHPSRKVHSKEIDCRVKPGNDDNKVPITKRALTTSATQRPQRPLCRNSS